MPARRPAISDEVLRREAATLSDDVMLLPEQVVVVTGLSRDQLRERARTRPPKPPLREPREKAGGAVWYSMGECRRYREMLREQVASAGAAATLREWKRKEGSRWPVALLGEHRRPVNFWMTLRGKANMARTDVVRWMTWAEFGEAKANFTRSRADARDIATGKRHMKRIARGGTARPRRPS